MAAQSLKLSDLEAMSVEDLKTLRRGIALVLSFKGEVPKTRTSK